MLRGSFLYEKENRKNIIGMFLLCPCGFYLGHGRWFRPMVSVNDVSEAGAGAESSARSGLAPSVSAKGAILIDGGDGHVIYEKNADDKLYPASTTKNNDRHNRISDIGRDGNKSGQLCGHS